MGVSEYDQNIHRTVKELIKNINLKKKGGSTRGKTPEGVGVSFFVVVAFWLGHWLASNSSMLSNI